MKNHKVCQRLKNEEDNKKNISLNNRYHKNHLTIINTSDSNTLSTFSTMRTIDDLKRKYNHMNFQQKINLRNTYNKILKLKNRYKSRDNLKRKIIGTEPNQENISKEKNKFLIQCTDKLSLINRTWDRKSNNNLFLHTDSGINNYLTISSSNKLKKSNEINYQIKSRKTNYNRNKMNVLNLKMLKNYSEQNTKTIREEFLKFDKSIKNFLDENNLDKNYENRKADNDKIDLNQKRSKSERPIKERINMLTSVKNKIKRMNKDLFKENETNKNPNVSIDSQLDLDFKHIKPKIMKENSIEDYFKEEQKNNKYTGDTLLKPVLIKSLPRPKLNIPKYPSFFHKFSKS